MKGHLLLGLAAGGGGPLRHFPKLGFGMWRTPSQPLEPDSRTGTVVLQHGIDLVFGFILRRTFLKSFLRKNEQGHSLYAVI